MYVCCADNDLDAAEEDVQHQATDTMDEAPVEAMPAADQDMAEEEQQLPEPMQEDKVPSSVHHAGLRDDVQGAQGTPKALASTVVISTLPLQALQPY